MYRIACPQCGKTLKFKSASRIGKKAKCPKCSHSFVLTLPQAEPTDEVELQLAPPVQPPTPVSPQQPMTGTSARWVPDTPGQAPVVPQTPPASVPQVPVQPQIPQVAVPQAPIPPTAPVGVPQPQVPAVPPRPQPELTVGVPDPSFTTVQLKDGQAVFPVGQPVTSPLSEIRKRNRKRGKSGLILGVIGLLLASGVGVAAFLNDSGDGPVESGKPEVVANQEWNDEKKALQESATAAANVSPTSGKPIDMKYLPPGANIVIHTYPARLWSEQDSRREFMFALGPLGTWLSERISTLTNFEPKEIEKLTIAIGLGPRESEPEISAVVRLVEAQQRTVIIRQRFKAARDPEVQNADVYIDDTRAWMLIDEKTFSVGPKYLADDLVASQSFPADPSDDLRALMQGTDGDRDITVMIDRSALEIHTPTLFADRLKPAIVKLTDWLGSDVDSAAFSLHSGDRLFMETRLRNGTGTTPAKLNRYLRSRVDELPRDVLDMVRFMRPSRSGPRQIIARFPAMAQAFSAATDSGIGNRFVQLTTILPERAIPNLAVGTILTWDESTRTDFNRERAKVTTKSEQKLPATLAGRLAMKVEIEFTRTPLQEAFALLGEDIGVTFKLDGDGLKLAGYTQNMAQSFNLGTAAAADGLKKILSQYDKMVLVPDESTMTMKVTTRDGIEGSGEKAWEFK